MSNWFYYIETYGCKINQGESGDLASAWKKLGGIECENPQDAQYILINSCAITSKAERDARNAVYRLKRLAPSARIILTGCAAQFFPDFQPRKNAIFARPDLCVPQKDKSRLLAGPFPEISGEREKPDPLHALDAEFFYRGRPIIKVQDGCSQNCAYCIVPQTRGKPVSVAPEQALARMRKLLEAGYGELIVSGVNLAQYGLDKPEYGGFWDLLAFVDRELAPEYAGRARLRISSLEPAQLTEDALDKLFALRLAAPHLHLSLQHASPRILRKMGRGRYSAESVLESTRKIASHWPIMGLGADIIVGFPGETGEDIKLLLDFMDEMPLTYAHVFPYSARQGTPARTYPNQLDRHVKAARAQAVREKAWEKRRRFHERLLDVPEMFLAPDKDALNSGPGFRRGMNEFYAPCFFRERETGASARGLLRTKPKAIMENGLLVEVI